MQVQGQVITFVNHDYQARNGMPASKVNAVMILDNSEPAGDRLLSLLQYTLTDEESVTHLKGQALVGKMVTIAFRAVSVSKAGAPSFRGKIVTVK